MSSPELQPYVEAALREGQSLPQIRQALLGAGWAEASVDAALRSAVTVPSSGGTGTGKNRFARPLIAVGVVVLLALAGGGAYFVWMRQVGRSVRLAATDVSLPVERKNADPAGVNANSTDATAADTDSDAVDDADILPAAEPVADADNGYASLMEGVKALKIKDADLLVFDDLFAGKLEDLHGLKKVADIVTPNEDAIGTLVDVAKAKFVQDPVWLATGKAGELSFVDAQKLARAANAYGYVLSRDGQGDLGLRLAAFSASLGSKILRSRNAPDAYASGLSIRDEGLVAMQKIIAGADVPVEALDVAQKSAAGQPDADALWVTNQLRAEYGAFVDALPQLQAAAIADGSTSGFQTQRTRASATEYARALIIESSKDCAQAVTAPVFAPPDASGGNTRGNTAAAEWAKGVFERFQNFRGAFCLDRALAASTQALLALRKNELAKGPFPKTLAELVPTYLEAVPIDPFDGKPIRYSAEKKVVYSVGPDRMDDGGSPGAVWRTAADPAFAVYQVPVPQKHVFFSVVLDPQEGPRVGQFDPPNVIIEHWDEPVFPGIDLRVECQDGRKVGINYSTGEVENFGALSDMLQIGGGAPQWIVIPDDVEGCIFLVSNHNTTEFLKNNPDHAAQLKDPAYYFDIYARNIDPEAKEGEGFFTSPTLTGEKVMPGEMAEYRIAGTLHAPSLVRVGSRKE